MERSIHNPWTWQERFGFVQANDVRDPARTVYCAGQTSLDADGNLLHEGDMALQVQAAIDNLETVLAAADLTLANIVRLTIYVADMETFLEGYEPFMDRLASGGCQYAGTLVEVSRLALPELLVELEATAVA